MSFSRSLLRYQAKRYRPLYYNLLILLIVFCSVLTNGRNINATPPTANLDEVYSIIEERLDVNEVSKEAYDHFLTQWNPGEVTFPVSSNESNNLEDSFKKEYFENWINNASYGHSDGEWTGNYAITTRQDQNYEFVKKTYEDGREIIEETMYHGRPRVTLDPPDLSNLDNITVPIRSKAEATYEPRLYTFNKTVRIGFHIDLPSFDKRIKITVGLIRFIAYAYFEVRFHLDFPVNLTIEHPLEVIEGAEYSLKCTLVPINLPNYNEFEILIRFGFGIEVQLLIPVFYWKKKIVKIFGKRTTIKVPKIMWKWKNVYGKGIDFNYHEFDDYKTPLAGETARINLPGDIDILGILYNVSSITRALSKFLRVGLGLGSLTVHGDKVKATLTASTGADDISQNVYWTAGGETNALDFRIPSSTGQNFLKLVVSKLTFHARKVVLRPYLFFGFKNLDFDGLSIPLRDWLGELRIPLPPLNLGSLNLHSRFSYATSDFSYVSGDVYDFTMDVNEVSTYQGQGTWTNINSHDHMYEITLQNGGRSDTVDLEVSGLPKGYTATLFREIPNYEVSSTPTNHSLIISAPEHFEIPPGPITFDITATSSAKKYLNLPDPSIVTGVSFDVPEINDIMFNLENNITEVIQVNAGSYIPISFFGTNWGNLNDTFFVNASLYTDTGNHTWNNSFQTDPYGTGAGQYFNGEFGFDFAIGDVFPSPGVYSLEIQATSQRNPSVIKKHVLYLNFTTVYCPQTIITPNDTMIYANWEKNFTLTLKNKGNNRDNFTLTSANWNPYLIFPTRVINLESLDSEEIVITLRIPDPTLVPPKDYQFRIITTSESSGQATVSDYCDANVKVLSPEAIPPGIVYVEPFYSPETLKFPQSTLILGPTWEAYDESPDWYDVFINNSNDVSGSWTEGVPILVPLTGPGDPYVVGLYNVTISFRDTATNIATVQEWVNITAKDTVNPVLTPIVSSVTFPLNFSQEQHLIWNVTEEFLLNATVYQDGSKLPQTDLFIEQDINETDEFRTGCIIRPGLPQGTYDFTLELQDMGNNSVSDTITVTIDLPDSLAPMMTQGPPSSVIQARGEIISITLTDVFPDRFELWLNTELAQTGTWQSNVAITFQVDDLNLNVGANDLELYVYDLANHVYHYTWSLTLNDIDSPTLLAAANNVVLYEHNLSQLHAPFWIIKDDDPKPGTYSIFQESTLVDEGSWVSGNNTIVVPIANLTPGIYQFYANFYDASGNSLGSSVTVTIRDILAPHIWSQETIYFEPYYTPDWFEMSITESYPDSYQVFKDGFLMSSGILSSDHLLVFVKLDVYSPGDYNYTFLVTDMSGNKGVMSVLVYITDFNPPLITDPSDLVISEGTEGNSIIWEILEANPHNFSIYHDTDLIESGSLTATDLSISISVDDLELGMHKFLILVTDQFGFSHGSICYVTVVDITLPLLTHLADCRFVTGDTNAELLWYVEDLHPFTYSFSLDGEVLLEETWTGKEIYLKLVGWSVGVYNVHLELSDTSGNIAHDYVQVEIIGQETKTNWVGSSPGFDLTFLMITLIILGQTNVKVKKRRK